MIAEIKQSVIACLERYKPVRIGIFGSFSRGEQNAESDIDLLVKFRDTLSLLEIIKIERELTEKLGRKVDLVTEESLKNGKLRDYILKDVQYLLP